MFGTKSIEITIKKAFEDLDGPSDVLYDPRSWSPDSIRDACNNLEINAEDWLQNDVIARSDDTQCRATKQSRNLLEYIVVNFILRNFFQMLHQTGLYNPQKKLWSLIAQTQKIKIKRLKVSKKDREHTQITDMQFEDTHGKYLKVRLVAPGSELQYPKFDNFISGISSKCVGLVYISDQEPDEKTLKKIQGKTNAKDSFDRYKSPINKNCSLDILKIVDNENSLIFKLIHPNLGKEIEAELCLAHS